MCRPPQEYLNAFRIDNPMKRNRLLAAVVILALGALGLAIIMPLRVPAPTTSDSAPDIDRGAYLVQAAGCISCHIDEDAAPALSGGRELHSPFGTFVVPNITPDPETGIGGWTVVQLVDAIRFGRSPEGHTYFPAFPYRSYRGMTESDARDIAAWLLAQAPVSRASADHELVFPVWLARLAMPGWNRLANLLTTEPAPPADPQIARGAYLARALGHCGECHTPRNWLGMLDSSREFAGATLGESEAYAITADHFEGWSEQDFAFFLFLGLKPDDEYVGGEMEPVIEFNTGPLTEEDRLALAAFFLRGQDQPASN
jgi:mono/diheme cytochrome c family protein